MDLVFENLDRLKKAAAKSSEYQCVSYRATDYRRHLEAIADAQRLRDAVSRLTNRELKAYVSR